MGQVKFDIGKTLELSLIGVVFFSQVIKEVAVNTVHPTSFLTCDRFTVEVFYEDIREDKVVS